MQFKSIVAEFDSIDGPSGTCIYLYQLQLNERGEPELSIDSCEQGEDIHELGDQEEKSLKSFLSNLYLKPKMEIYLRNAQIRPVRIQVTISLPLKLRNFCLSRTKCLKGESTHCHRKNSAISQRPKFAT